MLDSIPRERRRHTRLNQQLPIRIVGYENDGKRWHERSHTHDISQGGVSLSLARSSFKGQVLKLSLPLPRALREFDHDADDLEVYGIVRDTQTGEGGQNVGVMFYGKEPPLGFDRTPGAAFLLPGDLPASAQAQERPPRPAPTAGEAPPERRVVEWPDRFSLGRRRFERRQMFVAFHLEQVDEWGAVLVEERTVTENVSLGGARLKTSGRFALGDIVMLRQASGAFASRAEVKGFFVSPDGERHLGVMFLDAQPQHLFEGN